MHVRAWLCSSFVLMATTLAACSSSKSTEPGGQGGHTGASSASSPASSSGAGGNASDAGSDTDADPNAGDGGRDFSTNRADFFGPSRCAQANVLLCEDFESGTLDTKTWTVNGTMPVIDGVHAARGQKALHITKNGNGASYIKETKTFPAPNDTYWGRIFVYFEQLPTLASMTYSHWTFAAGSGTGVQGEIRLSGQMSSKGTNLFGVGTDSGTWDGGTGDWTNSDKDPNGMPSPIPTQEWLCIEWMHKGDTSETRFFWDATEHPSLYTSPTMHGGDQANPYLLPQFTQVWMGWQEYQASTEPFEMWLDEVIIDKERIGCVL